MWPDSKKINVNVCISASFLTLNSLFVLDWLVFLFFVCFWKYSLRFVSLFVMLVQCSRLSVKIVSEVTYCVSNETLNLIHSLMQPRCSDVVSTLLISRVQCVIRDMPPLRLGVASRPPPLSNHSYEWIISRITRGFHHDVRNSAT